MSIHSRLDQFENTPPHIVFEWNDTHTDAKGWLVINSLRGGAAGGGTRMRAGLDCNEVLSLAKTMEIKFTVAGPPIGGAKSGICFDPTDVRRQEVLHRWYSAVMPLLSNYYGTGGDLNVDELRDVIPITEALGLQHPQQGVVNGHYNPSPAERSSKLHALKAGVSKQVESPKYSPDPRLRITVSDMITGWGVSESIRHHYKLQGTSLEGKRVLMQGWGNVASAAAWYLADEGARIVGIMDKDGGLLAPQGLSKEHVKQLFLEKDGNKLLAEGMIAATELQQKAWDVGAEVLVPAAASRLITRQQLERMLDGGLEVVAAGANVPFNDPDIFYGPVAEFIDAHAAVIPDFIANCGMARTFAYLMSNNSIIEDEAIFEDVSNTIGHALQQVKDDNPNPRHITATAYNIALDTVLQESTYV